MNQQDATLTVLCILTTTSMLHMFDVILTVHRR